MDDFNTIRLKKKTLDKFKKYSKKTTPSYSETLDFMMAFFEDNNLSPYDTLSMSNTSLLNVFNKRMDAVVSIFRNVEETQLKPTKKMLESLFQEMEETKPLILEKTEFKQPTLINEKEELKFYRDAYHKKQTAFIELKSKFKDILRTFKLVKNVFSDDHYILKLSEKEFHALKDGIA